MWNYVSSRMTLNAISAEVPLAKHSKRNGQSRNTELSGSILIPRLSVGVDPVIADSLEQYQTGSICSMRARQRKLVGWYF